MNPLYFIEKMRRLIAKRRELVVETITDGSVPDYTAFKALRARLEELDNLDQELRDLQSKELSEDE